MPIVCEGTFYVWLRLPEGLTADRLLVEERVAVAPGEGFGPSGAGWVRLSLAVTDDAIDEAPAGSRARLAGAARMKIGIVVPFSWSYWGGVVEHSEHQAAALRRRGHDVKILMGNDPPGRLTRFLHPRFGPARRAARRDHPGRPLGRRAGERLAAEHRPLAALDPPHPVDPRGGAASTSSTCTSR